GGVGHRDDRARPDVDVVVAEPEAGPPGDHDVGLLLAALGLVVVDVGVLAGIQDRAVDPEVRDPEPLVERQPARGADDDLGDVGQVHHVGHVAPFLVLVSYAKTTEQASAFSASGSVSVSSRETDWRGRGIVQMNPSVPTSAPSAKRSL